ncbi:heme lyase NrfEFG subunit NrfF [Atlantibacter hermannii]
MRKLIVLLWALLAPLCQAQLVDTWAFHSPEQQQQALKVAGQLRCPQCQNQSLLESNSPVAVSMRHEVYALTEAGKSEAEIMTFMTSRYGEFVRYKPRLQRETSVLWFTPLALLLGIGLSMVWMRRRGARGQADVIHRAQGAIARHAQSQTQDEALKQELAQDIPDTPADIWQPQRALPARAVWLSLAAVLLISGGIYALTGRAPAVMTEQKRLADPLLNFTDEEMVEQQLAALQQKIRANPQDSTLWAELGEYYLYRNSYQNAYLAYQRAMVLRGENAELWSALATVRYYQAGQKMTDETRQLIDNALALDGNEVTARMLLASDAFMHADYAEAISQWQRLLDLNSPRVNRAKLIEAINMAKMLQNQG